MELEARVVEAHAGPRMRTVPYPTAKGHPETCSNNLVEFHPFHRNTAGLNLKLLAPDFLGYQTAHASSSGKTD